VASPRRLIDDVRSGESYALVLTLLLASLVVAIAAPQTTLARVVRDVVLSVTIVVAYWTATRRRAFFVPGVLWPSAALVFVLVGALEGARTHAFTAAIGAVLVGTVAYLVTRDLLRRGRVNLQTVFGALSLYVLLGMFFGLVYMFIADVTDAAFFARGDDGTSGEHLYYSFVAISTTGFGDLSPATGIGRALTVLEIVLGQLYLVTVVAVLVTTAADRRITAVRGHGLDD
jgi:Ion channel